MPQRLILIILALATSVLACGSDDTTGAGGASAGGNGTGAGGTGGVGGTGGSGGDGGGLGDVTCGMDICGGGDVCISRPQAPSCEPKLMQGDPCPPEMPNDTFCGGAGMECCCADPPPPIDTCGTPTMCDGVPSCDCLADLCPAPDLCTATATDGLFVCEPPPAA